MSSTGKPILIPYQINQLLNERQTAMVLGCSVHKLRRDRWAGGGCPFVKLTNKGAVRYRGEDLAAFIASRVRRSTRDLDG